MKFYKSSLLLFATITLLLTACQNETRKDVPDVSDIEIDSELHRFEQALFSIDTTNSEASITELEAQYPEFSEVYFTNILGVKKPWDTTGIFKKEMSGFINYPSIRAMYDTTQIVYGDFSEVKKELDDAFRFLKYYFPDYPTPDVYTFVSEYSYAAPLTDVGVGIGIDMFLGADYPFYYYPPLSLPRYLTRTLTKEHIPVKVMESIVEDIVGPTQGSNLLENMIVNGKKLYLLDLMLPYTADSLKLGFTTSQTEWCEANEKEMWAEIFVNELYSNDYRKFRKYITPSPHSPDMPQNAPGNTGSWVGWQIVKKYMAFNPDVTIEQLLATQDAQLILQRSRYKPKRR